MFTLSLKTQIQTKFVAIKMMFELSLPAEGEAPQGAEGEHEGEEKQKKKKKVQCLS